MYSSSSHTYTSRFSSFTPHTSHTHTHTPPPPNAHTQPSSSTLSPVTPPTPNSSTSYNSTCDSYSHLFSLSAPSVDNTGPPFPRVDNTGPPSPRVDNTGPPSPTDSCSYVLPNNMTKVNDGTERSTSWQKFGRYIRICC